MNTYNFRTFIGDCIRASSRDGIETAAIHGNKSQSAREKALTAFKNRSIRVLVATDVAARGLDIESLPHVVNYELPNVAEDYVHRIGRTGRAGKEGEAISLVSEDESKLLKGIERLLGRKIETRDADACAKRVGRDGRSSSNKPNRSEASLRGRNSSRESRAWDSEVSGEKKGNAYTKNGDSGRSKSFQNRRRSGAKETAVDSVEPVKKAFGGGWKRLFGLRAAAPVGG